MKMYLLRIEHPITNYEGWKNAFDNDPAGRQKSGVLQYRVLRPVDDAKFIMIDLEFNTALEAEALLAKMRVIWGNVEGKIMMNPKTRIVEILESRKY
ncbi:MAG: hypothetical protein ACHQJ4_01030 [Ignavibacteria bacterium]